MPSRTHFEQLKILGQPERLAVLRRLMVGSATLSQLGAHFGRTPAHIRHHLKVLQDAGLVQPDSEHERQSHLEKYYRATAPAWVLHLAVLPEAAGGGPTLIIASKDPATRRLVDHFHQDHPEISLQLIPLNSLDGLMTLRQGICHMATSHLIEPDAEGYNRSFVRHIFIGQEMAIVRLYHREEGVIVREGNPKRIRGLEDLARPGVAFVNREPGSGVRVWLDQRLGRLGIPPASINGYDTVAHSHEAVAQAVLEGTADAGLGTAACAHARGLIMIPLLEEPYELVLPSHLLKDPALQPFVDHLGSEEFRLMVRSLDGYQIPSSFGNVELVGRPPVRIPS